MPPEICLETVVAQRDRGCQRSPSGVLGIGPQVGMRVRCHRRRGGQGVLVAIMAGFVMARMMLVALGLHRVVVG